MIEQQLRECNGVCEYALYVKALILRRQGRAQESLQLFQAAVCLNPHNVSNLKQVGRSLYLLGKHKAALEVFEETQRVAPGDWEVPEGGERVDSVLCGGGACTSKRRKNRERAPRSRDPLLAHMKTCNVFSKGRSRDPPGHLQGTPHPAATSERVDRTPRGGEGAHAPCRGAGP